MVLDVDKRLRAPRAPDARLKSDDLALLFEERFEFFVGLPGRNEQCFELASALERRPRLVHGFRRLGLVLQSLPVLTSSLLNSVGQRLDAVEPLGLEPRGACAPASP